MVELCQEDRTILRFVSRAIFENPFGARREEVDRAVAGGAVPARPAMQQRVEELVKRLGRAADYPDPEQRELVEHATLFHLFHRHFADFEGLLVAQRDAGERSVEVTFADDVMRDLVGAGFSETHAVRFFEVFWQMHRAFLFVERSVVGESPSMRTLRASLWNCLFTADLARYEALLWNRLEDFSILLLGETGSGKGTAAQAIGRSGYIPFNRRRSCFAESFTQSLVATNLSEFPETLIEGELFGHKKGAFTGAVQDRDGVLDRCRPHGCIFLDEIGDVSVPIQIKLLRVLENREYTPVGDPSPRRFRGRILAATNRSLDERRASGAFREDFYYRLCSQRVYLPTLRQRLAEHPAERGELVEFLVKRILGRAVPEVSQRVEQAIDRDLGPEYGWPGNVRELEQCVRAVLLSGLAAAPGDGHQRAQRDAEPHPVLAAAARGLDVDARDLLAAYCHLLWTKHGTYEEVAKRTGLDRRTVRRHVLNHAGN